MKHDQDESADKYKLSGCVGDVNDEFGGVVTNCSAHRLSVVFINDGCYSCMHVYDVIRRSNIIRSNILLRS